MDKNIEMITLFDIYGTLLTKRQQEIFSEYYLYNLSLREIAENKDISYQAVRDSIKTSEKMLVTFETNIGMIKLKNNISKVINIVSDEQDLNDKKDVILELLGSEDDVDV